MLKYNCVVCKRKRKCTITYTKHKQYSGVTYNFTEPPFFECNCKMFYYCSTSCHDIFMATHRYVCEMYEIDNKMNTLYIRH
jgi:hypothetical protein